jgi:hypothetical protein
MLCLVTEFRDLGEITASQSVEITVTSSHARARASQLISFALFQKITHNILNNFLETKYSGTITEQNISNTNFLLSTKNYTNSKFSNLKHHELRNIC